MMGMILKPPNPKPPPKPKGEYTGGAATMVVLL
jgi:hypothetical protein